MTLELSTDQRDLQDSVRAMLRDLAGHETREAWRTLCGYGLPEIPFPTDLGGAGGTLADTAVITRELGRALSPVPYLSSIAHAGLTLLAVAHQPAHEHAASNEQAGVEVLAETIQAVARGRIVAALVKPAQRPTPGPRVDSVQLKTGADEIRVSGTHDAVIGADLADVFVVVAPGELGPTVAAVPAQSPGVTVTELTSLDVGRPLCRVSFDDSAVAFAHEASPSTLAQAEAIGLVMLAAEQVGVAEHCVDRAVEYAKTRRQFGRPIGSFQAIKHRLVDMHVRTELALCGVLGAVETLDDPNASPGDVAFAAHTARVGANEAVTFAASEAIHTHGGVGFSWDLGLHHYFRRAVTTAQLAGPTSTHLQAVTELARHDPTRLVSESS